MWLVSKKLHLSNLVALMFFAKEMCWFLHLSFTGTAGALREGFTRKKKVNVFLDFVQITSTTPHPPLPPSPTNLDNLYHCF